MPSTRRANAKAGAASPPPVCPLCQQPLRGDAASEYLAHERQYLRRLRRELAQPADGASAYRNREKQLEAIIDRQGREIDDQKRRLERLGTVGRGDIPEIDVFSALKATFPQDIVQRLGRAGDIVQTVQHAGRTARSRAGVILYECKNTAVWATKFLEQIREDGRSRQTPDLILVTRRLPRGEKFLTIRDGVVIVQPAYVTMAATVVRSMILGVHQARLSADRQDTKMAQLYDYINGDEFIIALRTLIQTASKMDALLAGEKRAHQTVWTRRQRAYADLASCLTEIDAGIREIIQSPSDRRGPRRLPQVLRIGSVGAP